MKVEYDPARDLLDPWLRAPGTTAATTETVSPGVHADVDREGTLIGLEILDASDVLQDNVQFEVELDVPTRSASASRGPEQNALSPTPRPCARRRTAPQGARIASRGTEASNRKWESEPATFSVC